MECFTLFIRSTAEILKIYTDGAVRGNPDPVAYAFIFLHNNVIIHKEYGYIGTVTNNSTECRANINALKAAEKFQ